MLALYALRLPDTVADAVRERLSAAVSPARRERLSRLVRPAGALRSVCGELLARFALARELGVPAATIRFGVSPRGKPEAASRPFNVSHAGHWVVAATNDTEIGVDVERHVPIGRRVVEVVLAPDERVAWERLPEAERASYFFARWTLKESLVKATGEGLFVPFDEVRFVWRDGYFAFLGETPWRAFHVPLEEGYTLAVCALDGAAPDGVTLVGLEDLA